LINSTRNYQINETNLLFPKSISEQRTKKSASFGLGKNSEIDQLLWETIGNDDYQDAQELISNTDNLFIGAFNGDFDRAWKVLGKDPDNVKMNFTITLGHELFHAYQFELGAADGGFLGGIVGKIEDVLMSEAQAVGFENYIRFSLFKDTQYGTTRATYRFDSIDEYWEQGNWWNYIVGFNRLELKEFDEGGEAYNFWKKDLFERSKQEGKKLLEKK